MTFEQSYSYNQKQEQKLRMNQQMQQSLQMLHMNQEDLLLFVKQKALGNPLIEVKVNRSTASNFNSSQDYDPMSQIGNSQKSLFAYVIEQIYLTMRETELRSLTLWLTNYLDENGYITLSIEDAAELSGADSIALLDALTLLQQLDPPGIGARDLQECLMLQTERDNSAPNLAYLILEESFDLISNRQWHILAQKYDVSLKEIQTIMDYIQLLTAHPGAAYSREDDLYVYPDLMVQREKNTLTITAAKSGLPIIRFQDEYYQDMSAVEDADVKQFIHEKYTEFNWLKNSLEQREETLVRVGTAIVERQKEFFLKEHHPLTPMTLKEIASLLNLHESTISRSVHDKYVQTDFGTFELKSFFTTALKNHSNKENDNSVISSYVVKQRMQQLIAEENKAKPLSDQKIADYLIKEDIQISRRTVAKYREELSIPSSSNRKRLSE